MTDMNKQEIAERAYQLWETEGRPYGRDLDHWFQAETELNRTSTKSAGARGGRGKAAASGRASTPRKKGAAGATPGPKSKKKA